ncbi:hypothetical protein L5515_008154 [Caenorhabditis briggsae]|uniref:Uncharacterized protein n=2 Tax=Caenorhabditis briggsae TaxID=6238 RepID=A0AAE9F6N5_CAEBR|nr:hypothetical protein L5515_008154 [Caenorhabditis briggsae]
MKRIFLCWLAIATTLQFVSAKRFMKMFADAGIGIHCPSGNKVYIHPISGDLQLCKQQLGVYNETSCPGGTACERFPILIPGFQDYCCWSEINPESESSTELEIVPPPMSKLKPGVTVEPIDEEEKVFPIDEEEEEDLKIEQKKSARKKISEEEEEEEDIEWEFETTTVKPRKTKSRKVPVITTTEPPIMETTTVKIGPSSRRPQCNDPNKTVLIDYGNRLRDCYFTQCLRGFKCEFNREIRRFICCGNEVDVPPAGLPPIPEPSPVIKRRPFRPNRPYNDGEEDEGNVDGENRGPRNPIVPFNQGGQFQGPIGPPKVEPMIENNIDSTAIPHPNKKSKYDEDDDYEDGDGNGHGGCGGNGCTYGRGRGGNQNSRGGCELNCRRNGGNNEGCGMSCRRGNGNNGNRGGNSRECGNGGCPWNGNNGDGKRPRRPRPDTDNEENENGCEADLSGMNGGRNGNNNGPVPPIPEPKPLCKGLQFKKSGNGNGNGNGIGNSNSSNNRNNGPPPRNNGNGNGNSNVNGNGNGGDRPMKPTQASGSGSNRRNGPPRNGGNSGNGNSMNRSGGNGRRNNNSGNNNNNNGGDSNYGGGGDNCDFENGCGFGNGNGHGNDNQRFSSRKQPPPKPSSSNNNGDRKVPRSVPFFPSSQSSPTSICPEGAEYVDGFTAPKCLPPAIDSCPMSHKKCRYSSRFGHHVCCNSQ